MKISKLGVPLCVCVSLLLSACGNTAKISNFDDNEVVTDTVDDEDSIAEVAEFNESINTANMEISSKSEEISYSENYLTALNFKSKSEHDEDFILFSTMQEAWSTLLTENKLRKVLGTCQSSTNLENLIPVSGAIGFYDISWDGCKELLIRIDTKEGASKLFVYTISNENQIVLSEVLSCSNIGIDGFYLVDNEIEYIGVDTSAKGAYTVYTYDIEFRERQDCGIIYSEEEIESNSDAIQFVMGDVLPLEIMNDWGFVECDISRLHADSSDIKNLLSDILTTLNY